MEQEEFIHGLYTYFRAYERGREHITPGGLAGFLFEDHALEVGEKFVVPTALRHSRDPLPLHRPDAGGLDPWDKRLLDFCCDSAAPATNFLASIVTNDLLLQVCRYLRERGAPVDTILGDCAGTGTKWH